MVYIYVYTFRGKIIELTLMDSYLRKVAMLISRILRATHLSAYSAKGNWSHFSMRQRYPQMLKAQTDPTINDFFFELFLRGCGKIHI